MLSFTCPHTWFESREIHFLHIFFICSFPFLFCEHVCFAYFNIWTVAFCDSSSQFILFYFYLFFTALFLSLYPCLTWPLPTFLCVSVCVFWYVVHFKLPSERKLDWGYQSVYNLNKCFLMAVFHNYAVILLYHCLYCIISFDWNIWKLLTTGKKINCPFRDRFFEWGLDCGNTLEL